MKAGSSWLTTSCPCTRCSAPLYSRPGGRVGLQELHNQGRQGETEGGKTRMGIHSAVH